MASSRLIGNARQHGVAASSMTSHLVASRGERRRAVTQKAKAKKSRNSGSKAEKKARR